MADVLLCSTYEDQKRDFVYEFKDNGKLQRLTVPLPIPLKISAQEFVQRLISFHNLPCYLETNLVGTLDNFMKSSFKELHDRMANLALKQLSSSSQATADYVSSWTNAFTQEHADYSSASDKSEETAFSEMYHSLIHSAALETLLQLENTYAMAMDYTVSKKGSAIEAMEEKHQCEMEESINNLGVITTDKDVNDLAARHCEDAQMLETYWSSELSQLQELQKREYREWVTTVHEDLVTANSDPSAALNSTFSFGKNRSVSVQSMPVQNEFSTSEHEVRFEESFTILLGAQKKTTHNLRLVCGNVLDLCKHKTRPGGSVLSQPHRIQTALSLYSESLAGLILLVEDRINTYSGIMKDFANICQQSGTEFHFPDLDKQLCLVQQNLERRDRSKSTLSRHQQQPSADNALRPISLETGDMYITRHSNLSEVHVVFHLVVDDSVKSSTISTRNPVIVGLRNALHTAVRHSITTITVPLLLFHEMTEEMTVSWCMKRAELIFKCVKGFMMECSSWSGAESLHVQFMVPKGISEEMFTAFSSMLPSIFRVSTPLDLTSSATR